METISGIYKITNNCNSKSYIGKSKDIQTRWRAHHTEPFNPNADMYDSLFYRAIRKYGIDNFSFEILEYCSEEQLNEREQYWISYYNTYINSLNCNGYNMTVGGESNIFEKQYDRDLIQKLWNEGKSHQEIIDIIHCTKSTLTNILDELQISPNERRRRGASYKAKGVIQYNLNHELIQEYISISEASRQTNIPTGNISKNCKGGLKTAGGYIWEYKE